MNGFEPQHADDVEQLLGDLEAPVATDAGFRAGLEHELAARLAPRRGEGPLPEGWAYCPFDRFCIAEQRLPRQVRMHCPCLHAGAVLRLFAGGQTPVHARPCPGRALRAAGTDRGEPAGE
ncbi:MAG TPA: hypothetical protein VKV26_08940 [Dehalococcoidia bacterium]|nr:hypothetical protein [Dehalococcoidia bacterium]